MKLAILICATRAYTHAMAMQARRVQQCLALSPFAAEPGHVILSGDDSAELREIAQLYRELLPGGWAIHHVRSVPTDEAAEQPHKRREHGGRRNKAAEEERKRRAFRRIADMREAAHARATSLGVTHAWSLDSDVLPPPNALRASLDALAFDGGWYGIAFCPYANELWLGGRGSASAPMAEDFLPHERALPGWLRGLLERCEARMKAQPTARRQQMLARAHEWARRYPPDGNVHEVNGKYGWRKRGWVDHAYPALGLGAVVPSDWCGFGCTLMGREALARADFAGFLGHGTEDIEVIRNKWTPAGIRIALLLHCPCDHVYLETVDGRPIRTFFRAYHEPEGEYAGHLRYERRPLPLPERRQEKPDAGAPDAVPSPAIISAAALVFQS